MVVGITQEMSGFPTPFPQVRQRWIWDSRECPGPITEAELSRPSTRRALTAGAIALAVIAPTLETAERPAEASPPPPNSTPEVRELPRFDPLSTFGQRAPRASRSLERRAGVRPAVAAVKQAARRAAQRERLRITVLERREAQQRRIAELRAEQRRELRERIDRSERQKVRERVLERRARTGVKRTVRRVVPRMAAVIAFARAQVGKPYGSGGSGPRYFDCSGFTKRAYALAGIRLPHSSGAQAARARRVSRAEARPGDLVIGPGHVGIYMGRGMMIDAGNSRTGVIYRRLYAGLSIARL